MTTGPTGAATPELSVIVPAYGRLDALRGLLASLRHQRLAASRYEVLLVDDGNPRPLADALAGTLPDRVRVLRQDPNAGPAAAKNLGLRGARGRICLFLNADAVLEPATLAAHLALHPEGGPVRAVLGRFDSIPACRSTLLELTHRARLWFPYEEMTPGAAHSCRYFWTCNLSLPTDVVRRAGGFDPRFRAPAWEDVELGYRLEQRGIQVEYHPHLGCGHDHAVDLAATVRRSRLIGHDWVRVARKHGPAAMPLYTGVTACDARQGVASLQRLLAATAQLDADLATLTGACDALDDELRVDPEAFDERLEEAAEPLAAALGRVHVYEMLRGTVAALFGFPLDALARCAAGNERVEVIAPGAQPSAAAEVIVSGLVPGSPSPEQIATARRFLAVSPAVGQVTVAPPLGPVTGALKGDHGRGEVVARRARGGTIRLTAWPGRPEESA